MFLERPFASLFGASALALGLILAGLSLWMLRVTDGMEGAIEEQVVLRAHLDPKLDEAATRGTLLALGAIEGVREVAWVGPQAQRAELVQILGAELLAGLDDAVFPRGGLARVTLERGVVTSIEALDALRNRVERVGEVVGVESAPYESRHLAVIFDAADATRGVGLLLAALALVVGALTIYQRIALGLAARRQELVLYRSFGATERWLMGRYFALALLIGGAAAAIGILVGLFIDQPLAEMAALMPGNTASAVTSPEYLLGNVAGGLGGALLACFYAVRHEQLRGAS
jgi:putative ABC transport system permease protein